MNYKKVLLCLAFLCSTNHALAQTARTFTIAPHLAAKIWIDDQQQLKVQLDDAQKTTQSFALDKPIDDELAHAPRLATEDYNFDGFKDFAVYAADAGQGVSIVYSIFLYQPKMHRFTPLTMPEQGKNACDWLADVQLNSRTKTLRSSCRGGARWHTDIWRFNLRGRLVLVKTTG